MKILLTGTTGFVGSHLATYLVQHGFQVSGLIRQPIDDEYLASRLKNVSLYVFDENKLVEIIKQVNPEIVIHLSSLYLTNHNHEHIDDLFKSNLIFPTKLLEAMSINNVTKFINTGTSWQHFNSGSYEPVNLYAATKQAFEDIIKYYVSAANLSCITLKLFDTYGPNDNRGKLISLLDKLSQTNEKLSMSAGEQLVELTHIDDVCSAYLATIELITKQNSVGISSYGVSSKSQRSLRDLVALYETVNKVNLNIAWGERPYREREVMTLCENLEYLPNWKAKIELSDGLKIENRV